MSVRPALLCVTPVVPDTTGNGFAMRAGQVVQHLAAHYEVSLLAVAADGDARVEVPDAIARTCVHVHVETSQPPPSIDAIADAVARLGGGALLQNAHPAPFGDMPFDIVHAYRLAAVPRALPYLLRAPRAFRMLDLDEVESATCDRLAEVLERDGDWRGPALRAAARSLERIERAIVGQFDQVFVCSPRELAALPDEASRHHARVLPNTLPDVPVSPAAAQRDIPFTFLFVGSLSSPANVDAVAYACREVVPLLRAAARRPFRVVVVGPGASDDLVTLCRDADVDLRGAVADVVAAYDEAHVVIAPLRSGGGTRLKVIEAMRGRRPVVATSEAIAGIALTPEAHVLVGDTPATFAAQCVRLMEAPSLAERIARAAREVYVRDHRPAVMGRVISAAAADFAARPPR